MESDEDTLYDVDSGNESSGDEDEGFPIEPEPCSARESRMEIDEFPFEVLTTEHIVLHMIDCIKEVNSVVEV